MSKLAKFRSRHGDSPKRNPPLATDVMEYLVPGFAAFVLDRFVTRFAAAQIAKRWPKLSKHAGAIAAVGTFGAAWFGAHRVKYLEKYHHPIVIGAGLAAAQSLVQLYLPKLNALIGDPMPPQAQQPLLTANVARQLAPAPAVPQPPQQVPPGFKPTTANEWYTYNDSYDAGSYKGKVEAAPPPTPGEQPADDMDISSLLDNSDLQLGNEDMGLS
jgi:hypothetical protein